ncbi:msx2-interacting protein [Eucyclogobius newberryi]|uniref:msx2-interacting protein n=1 Tax=Eucyclogobius newberryi TaxID=166745 RepID=UPI003B5ACD5B
MVRETRHLWVGNLPENVREEKIVEHFKRYGRVESVKVLPKRGSEGGVAAFVDFVDIKSAQKAHNAINKMGDRDLRTDYNEPGTIPSAARALDDSLSLGSRGRDVSGFTRASSGSVYGPTTALHSRDGRYERRLDGTAESRDRTFDHSTYGHHERPGSSFERQRHYEADYYRSSGSSSGSTGCSGSAGTSGVVGTIGSGATGGTGVTVSAGCTTGASAGSTSSVVAFYRSHSRSPCRFETAESRYESRAREAFTLSSVVHRDLYREERARRGERPYRRSRSRSPHSAHSRNPSPQRLVPASRAPCSRSGSGSHSRSSSSDSVSSTSSSTSGSDSSSSSSDESPARSVQSAAVPAHSALLLSSLDKDEPRKSFGIKVQNLPVRSTDTSLKDGLFHEFKKHGKVTSVQIHGASEERYGLVFFRQQEDQEKALAASKGKLFFGMQIDVTAWNGPETESENEFRPLDERIDEFHPKATRTLFIGNLEKTTTYHDLLNIFQRFGEIVDIDIKKVNGAPQYAFLQYCDIASVCKAIKKMDGEYLGNNRLKLGFGKSMPTTCVWLDGLASNTTEQFLTRHFCRYGHVVKVVFDRMKGMALILYNNIEYAQAAVKDTKGWKIGGSKIKVDFANQESQMAFYRSMQASGQDIRDVYDIVSERRDERRTQYEYQAERQYYENVRTTRTYTDDPSRKYTARSREFYTEWDPYQGDYYETQYFEDPREYREYRADPYEQDIRKYSYLQRERERERERFETDRGRDHNRRTVERSQSPSHLTTRRPASPTASPPVLERVPAEPERRVCCRSSDRSGSCSSISPPRFDKPEKTRPERFIKSEKIDKERVFEPERSIVVEKEKRVHKERGDKEKRLKKSKSGPPGLQAGETETDLERDTSPDTSLRNNYNKSSKESSNKGRLDIMPCVVQLTRVKEKEGKLFSHAVEKCKGGSDSPQHSSPIIEQRSPLFLSESPKGNVSKHGKNRDGLAQSVDRDLKNKHKKHGKSELGFDIATALDADRLAARKRRFEDTGSVDKLKRSREDNPSYSRHQKAFTKETETDITKPHKKENLKERCFLDVPKSSPQNRDDYEGLMDLECQAQLRDHCKNSPHPKQTHEGSKCESLLKLSDECLDNELKEEKYKLSENEQGKGKWRDWEVGEVSLSDQKNVSNKQTQPIQWLMQKLTESEKLGTISCQLLPCVDKEKDFLSDTSTTVETKTDDNIVTCNQRKPNHFQFENKKIDDSFENTRPNEDSFLTSPTESSHYSANAEEEIGQISLAILKKERNPQTNESKLSVTDPSKSRFGRSSRYFSNTHPELSKLCCDEGLMQHWNQSFKTDLTYAAPEQSGIQKHLGQDLEPGEVQSDSDEELDTKQSSPSSNSSLSFILRERDERLTDLKLSASLEKNKFYSFALDKTITPDTKALLDRAKTLYSTREDNWSFLPSRFPTSHSCSVKNKEELAPRPIPSWYMKKKKVRTDSVEKISSKNEELKSQDPERQELFASRFLHSSIFEQDSRRLQHLERTDQDIVPGVCKPVKPHKTEVKPKSTVGASPQEPIVLFRSRFLELQQHKDKDHFSEHEFVADVKRDAEVQKNHVKSEKEPESGITHEDKPSSPQLTLTLCTSVPLSKESTLRQIETQATEQPLKGANIDLEEHRSPSLSPELKQTIPKITMTHLPVASELNSDSQQKETKKEKEHVLAKETVEERSVHVEKRTADSDLTIEKKPNAVKNELQLEEIKLDKEETKHSEDNSEECVLEPETDSKPVISRRQSKNKRSKPVSVSRASKASHTAAGKKTATRKSERIDKEKLKKAMSPQAEGPKPPELKTTSKSSNPSSDSEQKVESGLIHGRTRRRNVRSLYATLREVGEETPPSSRLTRKRAASKDPLQDDPPVSRRGRPPKRGIKRSEVSAVTKLDEKTMVNNTEVKETDLEELKESEGGQPRTPRHYSAPNAAGERKGIKKYKADSLKKLSNKDSMDSADEEEEKSETKINETEMLEKCLEKTEIETILCKTEKESSVHKKEQTDIDNDANLSENKPEKSGKTKTAWVKRNIKLEERSHNLKNLEIRVSVDDVKGLLRSEDNEQDSFQNSNLKAKMVIQEKAESELISNDSKNLCLENKDETLSESELNTDPTAALLARQKELEQAVENIAKLAAEQPARPYKESANATSTVLPPASVEPEEPEEEKRANPASETELAAAIDSITAEVTCAEGDGFTTTSTYPALAPNPGSASSSSNDITEPETHVAISNVAPHSANSCLTSPHETLKKTGKVPTKSPKKPRGRKTTKREDMAAKASELQPSPSRLPESIPEDSETPNSIGITVTTGTSVAATVVTAVATCRRDVTSSITVDTPKEAAKPEVEQPVPKESACQSGTFKVSVFKKHPLVTEHPNISLHANPHPSPQQNVSQRVPKISHWTPKSEESRIYVPPCHVTVVTPSIPSTALGNTSTNPPLPPDTKASDIDPSSSTLRKILMEPKYVSASSTSTMSTTITTTVVTSSLANPVRMSEKPAPIYPEERTVPFQPISHKPSPLTESRQNYRDKPHNAIIQSPTTSVISRIPLPYDTEETPRISLSSRNISPTTARQKHRPNSNENTRYHSMGTVDDAKRGRLLGDAHPFSSASVPGLRVNTSEGVVVLSYSGQKTEGPQRMRAKISQIPPASVVDVEFQQSVSKTEIKQEASQLPSPKVFPNTLAYRHTGGQAYNTQNVITTTKQNSPDKSDAPYHTSSQGGVVKMFQQPGSSPKVLMYNQPVIQQHGKRALGHEPPTKKIDTGKGIQTCNLSPVMCPPHAPLSGTCISPSPGIPTDRSVLQGNQEPQSPRTTVQSPPPYLKTCSLSNSTIGTSVVLGHSVPSYTTIQHTHSEQSSVIIQPHSVSHTLAHTARADNRSVSGINYGKRSDSHTSSNPGPPQRSNASQSNVIHSMVLQSHLSPKGSLLSGVSGAKEDISRHLNQAPSRHSVSQPQPDVSIIHSEHRALHTGGRMDQYRDLHQRMLMHQQLGDQASAEVRQLCSNDPGSLSSSHISQPIKSSLVSKGIDLTTKGPDRPPEAKLVQSPSSDSRIRGVHVSSPIFSHPHGVKIIQPGAPGSYPVYQDMQTFPTQFSGHLSYHKMTNTQVPLETGLGHRGKLSHSHRGGSNPKPDTPHVIHATSTDYSHISRIPRDTISPSYQSPISSPIMSPGGLNHKQETSVVKQPPTLLRTPSPAVPPSPIQPHQDIKQEHTGHRSFDMIQLLTKYPIVWQGHLALKNDQAAVQLHFVSGNSLLAQHSLPPPEGAPLLRIVQRMRLEASQLDSVARRMTVENDYCVLLALPCGRDQEDVLSQTHALKTGFITYLQAKQAAGIINVANPGSNQPAFVVQIFPPCEFSESHLSHLASDLLNSISSISPHLMIVIASV